MRVSKRVSIMEVCEKSSSVCGYYVYRIIWDTAIGEDWVCERESSNEHNRYAVAIIIERWSNRQHWPLTSKDLTIMLVVSEEGE